MNYSLSDIAKIVDGKILQSGKEDQIRSVFIDSRSYHGQQKALFIAIQGDHHNANSFVKELYQSGQRLFLISENLDLQNYGEGSFILVEDGLKALQNLAKHHRSQFDIPVIGVTGSNGKTIVKEWLYHLLKDDYNICRSPKSYNSKVGVPLSILQLREDHTLGIFEAGISQPGEMEVLRDMIQPSLGVLTHIGSSHIENFKDAEELRIEKEKLFNGIDQIAFDDNSLRLTNSESDEKETALEIVEEQLFHTVKIPFSDQAAIQNSLTVIKTCRYFNLSWSKIKSRLIDLPPIAMRLELLDGVYNSKIINDTYNSDVSGLDIALNQMQKMASGPKAVILSSIQKDQGGAEHLYHEIFERLNNVRIDHLILIGDDISQYQHLFKGSQLSSYTDTDMALKALDPLAFKDHWILIKGARKFHFERLLDILESTPHSTRLEIRLDHMSHNLQRFKSLLTPDIKIMCMVKAMAYGTGEHEIYRHLANHRIDYFGVAYAVEGMKIREAGIDIPVMVMNADAANFPKLIEYDLEPVIYSLEQLDQFIRVLINKQITAYPIHIELDTGMHRLGFEKFDLPELEKMILAQPEVKVKSIFSHLAAADDPSQKDATQDQITLFDNWSHQIIEELNYPVLRHICNSSGIIHFPDAHFDMVRLGVGIYGISDLPDLNLKPVSTLKTTITQIKTVKAGEGIGYGFTDKAETDLTIGIIPIGYADGLKRQLSNGKGQMIHCKTGSALKIVGKVCMDMTMLAIGDVFVHEGDDIEIFGDMQSINDFAHMMDTIPYETLTSISSRVKRIYTSG